MLNPEKDPPTHTAWSQHRDRGKFREWYKRGHAWIETTPQGQTIFCVFEGIPGPRGYDGFIYAFPNGIEPPPPPKAQAQPQRPAQIPDAFDGEEEI
jgi:hypothetical protein